MCGTDNINYADKDDLVFKGINTMYCIQNKTSLYLRSTFAAAHFNMFDIRLNLCVNSTANSNGCATTDEMAAFYS